MFEIFVTVAITLLVLSVLVPLALAYLLLRQVLRTRIGRRVFGRRRRPVSSLRQQGSGPRQSSAPLGRQWRRLAGEAVSARNRFVGAVSVVAPGPLRATLDEAVREVDAAVADAQRLAGEGSAADRAHHDVLAALERQRRRARHGVQANDDLAAPLAAATRAQQASAQRLGEASRHTLCQLQLVVARLHELTAHCLELTTMARHPSALPASVSVADRLAALREATAEVDRADVAVAL